MKDFLPNKLTAFQLIFRQILGILEYLGLAAVAITTVVASWMEIITMYQRSALHLGDLLLLFLYLEILAMVSRYFRSGQMPVRFPIYIAMVAIARYIIVEFHTMSDNRLLISGITVLVLASAVLVIRFGHVRYPYTEELNSDEPLNLPKP